MDERTVVTDYTSLIAAMRRRADELDVSRLTLDAVAGLASGHSGKILGGRFVKPLGPVSLGALLGALGLRLVVEPDPEQLERVRPLLDRRKRRVAEP